MAFTDEQNEQIRKDLIREARRCGITIGMRKTSVEQLTNSVGISKGSFYKFFDSKELLFFAVLEDIHTECFAAAQKSLQENTALLPTDRAAAAILAACRWLAETKAFVFIENDADFLLHRLPEEVKTAHYHDDETHIRALLEGTDEEISATLCQGGKETAVTLYLPGLTREERDIILAGCLINYYRG